MTAFPDVSTSAQSGRANEATTTSMRVEWAPVPRVDLLPAEIVDGRRLARLKRVLVSTLIVVAGGCAAAVVWAQFGISSAQAEVDTAQARAATLQAEQAKYAEVPKIDSLIDTATTARQTAMSQDVLWYGFLSDLSLTTPKGVSLTSLQATLDDSSTPSGAAVDPLATPGIGEVSFGGTADHFDDVAGWLNAVSSVHGFDGSTLQTASRGQDGNSGGPITFTSSVKVTSKALTHRYDRKAD